MAKIDYIPAGDYFIPALTMGDLPENPIGKYGVMRFRYLETHNKKLYCLLEMKGQLDQHLSEIDEAATRQVEDFIAKSLETEPAPDRNANPMGWVRHMESLKARAEEIVMRELIFA
jgi:hypothetical protein